MRLTINILLVIVFMVAVKLGAMYAFNYDAGLTVGWFGCLIFQYLQERGYKRKPEK